MSVAAVAIPAIIAGAGAVGSAVAKKKAADAALEAQADTNLQQRKYLEGVGADVESSFTPYSQLGEKSASELMNFNFDYGGDDFSYDKDINDFLDPSTEFQRKEALDAMEQSAALGGGLHSGSTYAALQDRAQDYAMQDYNNSFNRMTTDKNFAYGSYIDKFNQDRTQVMDNYNKTIAGLNTGLQATNSVAATKTGNATAVSNLMGTGGDINALQNSNSANAVSNAASGVGAAAGTASALYTQQMANENALNSLNSNNTTSTTDSSSNTGIVSPQVYNA